MDGTQWFVTHVELVHDDGNAFVAMKLTGQKISGTGVPRGATAQRTYVLKAAQVEELAAGLATAAERERAATAGVSMH